MTAPRGAQPRRAETAFCSTYRHELRHLLELSGFEPIAEYSDYAESPPAYGGEIVVVARRMGRSR